MNSNQPKTIDEVILNLRSHFHSCGIMRIEPIPEEVKKILKPWIEAEKEISYSQGYENGVRDELECVETSGEHLDVRNKIRNRVSTKFTQDIQRFIQEYDKY